MRYFPIHILIKDFVFLTALFFSEKMVNNRYPYSWRSAKEILGISVYVETSFFITNILIFTIVYLLIPRTREFSKPFLLGTLLHIPTLLLALYTLEISLNAFLIASIVSLFTSGFLYKSFCSGFSFEKSPRKHTGLE